MTSRREFLSDASELRSHRPRLGQSELTEPVQRRGNPTPVRPKPDEQLKKHP